MGVTKLDQTQPRQPGATGCSDIDNSIQINRLQEEGERKRKKGKGKRKGQWRTINPEADFLRLSFPPVLRMDKRVHALSNL
ncbi:hypothetical protein I7I53_03883 [Histoplasma capsulatum var. duboisii H88]|uniref:Uncharacterized protein n=1 Tax=Ajellomyces capsulatus (strain H88) TaxID=544711 RepID=A0A8A1LUV4_AJEC8|nr:hypothetical protein I7I53_03883 [Histoplasma capsulatum var. duboisii H88]